MIIFISFQLFFSCTLIELFSTVYGASCPGINCFIEYERNESILNCKNQSQILEKSKEHLFNCEYEMKRKSVTITPISANDDYADRLAVGFFQNILDSVNEINEIHITHIKINIINRSDFPAVQKLKGLTLMNPGMIEENSLIDIINPNYFQLYIYCIKEKNETTGISKLRIPANSWRIILRDCSYSYGCELGFCVEGIKITDEYNVKFQLKNPFPESETVIRSSNCLKPKLVCTTSTRRKLDSTSNLITNTLSTTSKLGKLSIVTTYMKLEKELFVEKTKKLKLAEYNQNYKTILIIALVVSLVLIIFIITIGWWRYQRNQDRKPCRGKHTMVLKDDFIIDDQLDNRYV